MRATAVIAALLLAGCVGDVGTAGPGPGSNPSGDTGDASVDGPHGPIWIDAGIGSGSDPECVAPQTNYGTGEHNTGRSCMQSCHNHGFTLSGTIYTSPTNNTGYVGSTITITDNAGKVTNLTVNANGNFYSSASFAFPVTVHASDCPYGVDMVAPAANGDCNSGNCHQQAGGAAKQMHLP